MLPVNMMGELSRTLALAVRLLGNMMNGTKIAEKTAGMRAMAKQDADVRWTGRVMDIPVGEALFGRVLDAKERPLDGGQSA